MPELKSYDISELTQFANQVKDVLFYTLEREGIIENSKDLCINYSIVVNTKGFFGKLFDSIVRPSSNDSAWFVNVVKHVHHLKDEKPGPTLKLIEKDSIK